MTTRSQFGFTNISVSPRIDLMRRKIINNVYSSEFIKVGTGVMIDLYKDSWSYAVGHDAVDNKGRHYTAYDFVQYVNGIPAFSKYIFFVSLSYSFLFFDKQ